MKGASHMATIRSIIERAVARGWSLVPLRLMIGFGFAAHGYAKLARGPRLFAAVLSAMGIPAPVPTAWVTTWLELVGGVALMLGAAVAPLALPLTVVMLTAMFGVHWRYGFSSVKLRAITPAGAELGPTGYEINLLYIAALVTLALHGPTPLSIDGWIARRRGRLNTPDPGPGAALRRRP
jgi:putative oxidoreductase